MRIETPEPFYKLKMIPESPADFHEAIESLCDDYGCLVTISGDSRFFGIEHTDTGFRIFENVERRDYWRENYSSLPEMLEKCRHFGDVPLSRHLGKIAIQPICDCA